MKNLAGQRIKKLIGGGQKTPVEELETCNCKNCGHEFKGHFCPNCGQEVGEFNQPFGFIIYDFMGNFFAFDTRFLKTFKYLLFYPGFLTKEFFKGKRASYSPPFRIFVFLSFILFLLLAILTDRKLDTELSKKGTTIVSDESLGINQLPEQTTDLKINDNRVNSDTNLEDIIKNNNESDDLNINLDKIFTSKNGNLRTRLNELADTLENQLSNTEDPKDRRRLQEYVLMCRSPEIFVSNVFKYLSWASFILLPLFALILKLFYIRRKKLYIQHLIFSIHLHSFLFVVLILFTMLRLIFNTVPGVVNFVLLFSMPVYIFLALRNFYNQGWIKTFVKFFGIGMIYNFTLATVVLLTFLKSLHVI